MRFPDTLVLVYAKAPVRGEVNTRLIPAIGEETATGLHKTLLEHRLRQLNEARLCDTVLMCAPDTRHEFFQYCRQQYAVRLLPQTGRDLGERMANGAGAALQNYRRCIVVGTDAPALTAGDIQQAVLALEQDVEVVFVPAEDGGYVLVGMTRLYPRLFQGVRWGTDAVMRQSRARLVSGGIRYREMPVSWDIDCREDYERYLRMPPFPGPAGPA